MWLVARHRQCNKKAAAYDTNLKALNVVLYLALVQLRYEVGLVGVFPASFQSIEHDSTELLDIVLLPRCTTSTPPPSASHCKVVIKISSLHANLC